METGTLYLVGTPIGNLEDITFRAVRILQTVDAIAAEDTRHTGKLLQHFQINKPQISYHHHNRLSRQETLINELKQGKNIALVSDAGMPTLSDPGYDLVNACVAQNIPVIPIPGVTAVTTAIAVSGLNCDRFVFEGFLPPKGKKRRERLTLLGQEGRTMVFYEAPHRVVSTLQDFCQVFGENRQISIARELTKVYESIWCGELKEAMTFYENNSPKGEFTLVVAGKEVTSFLLSEEEVKKELKQLLDQGFSRSQASRQLAELTSLSRRQVYELSLDL
ncbi:MAG: 16S rRNA (cytidine(1402)-2'-O)-methyltransferase [Microcystaceae cyanobacterium]